jgi:23S rRNA (adenine2030-N6)-methyltransferase
MNYRHVFHAGNFADVFKHAILVRLLVYLGRKETPFRVIDTHAGEGLYDLADERAEKTAEWRAGIGRVLAAAAPAEVAALLEPYLSLVRPLMAGAPPLYPGSPALAQKLTRAQDRMIFCDAHPQVIPALTRRLGRDPRIKVIEIDGYRALNAFVPPRERRGLVLVDPPFESKAEFEMLKAALRLAVAKWPTGIFAIWFPIKDKDAVAQFVSSLAADLPSQGIKNALYLRLGVAAARSDAPLAASGLIILNPPFTLDVEARLILPYLGETMATMGRGDVEVAWLVKH